MQVFLYIAAGFLSGMLSGIFGIGGGTLMVPMFIFFFGLTQHEAQGTALAVMVLPVFLLAALQYYWAGHVKVPLAVFVALGFVLGGFIGAHWIQNVPDEHLKKGFGILLALVGLQMALTK